MSLTKRRVMGLLDFHIGSGPDLRRAAAAAAGTRSRRTSGSKPCRSSSAPSPPNSCRGHEIWLTRGSLVQAMRASYALPGVFDPVMIDGRWLMDGALVNPIPITAARALEADLVICVNLNGEIRVRGTVIQNYESRDQRRDWISRRRSSEPRRWGIFPAGRAAKRQSGCARHGDRHGRRLQHHAGPHRPLAPRRRSARHHDLAEARQDGPVRVPPRARNRIALGRQATERALPEILELIRESQHRLIRRSRYSRGSPAFRPRSRPAGASPRRRWR